MQKILNNFKKYTLRGLFASIPLAAVVLVVYFLYATVDRRVVSIVDKFTGISVPGLGIILVLVILYVIGFVASSVLGKRMMRLIEKITERIPLVKTTYKVGKQISVTLSDRDKQVLERVVLVRDHRPDAWDIGFVVGTIKDNSSNEIFLKVYIPTAPNPTSGAIVLLKEAQTRDSGWSVDEAMKFIISGGLIGPEGIR